MHFLLQREIVLYRAIYRLGLHFDGGAGRKRDVDRTRVRCKLIRSAATKIAVISDAAAGGVHGDRRSRDVVQNDFSAAGADFHMAAADIGQSDRATHGMSMHVSIVDV